MKCKVSRFFIFFTLMLRNCVTETVGNNDRCSLQPPCPPLSGGWNKFALSFYMNLSFFMVIGCSPSALMVERAVAPGTLTVMQLSDNGAIEQTLDQLPLNETIAGPSEVVVRDGRVYIASYKQLSIAESGDDGKLRLLSSLLFPGYDAALTLHSTAAIAYITNTEGLLVIDVADPTQPKRIAHLKLADELGKLNLSNPLNDPVGTDIGCEDNKLVLTLQGEGESPTHLDAINPSRPGIAVVFDVAKPHSPQIEQALDPLPGASTVEMGIYRHQTFVAGDEMVEYQDFKREPMQSWGLWFKNHPREMTGGEIPGNVVEMKFVMGSREDWETGKTEAIIKQYRHANPQERRELETLTPLDQGIVFIATEHAVVPMDTSHKWLSWRIGKKTVSDHFSRLYGIDIYGHSAVYVAAGAEGVYLLRFNPFMDHQFKKWTHLKSLPAPALDVAVSGDKLYVLCGELHLRDVQHNENLIAN